MTFKEWKEMMTSEDGEFHRISDEEKKERYINFLFTIVIEIKELINDEHLTKGESLDKISKIVNG